METIECTHIEEIGVATNSIRLGACAICGQVVQYGPADSEKPTVTKLGRLVGRLVLPRQDCKLLLDMLDAADLAKAMRKKEEVVKQPFINDAYFDEHRDEILADRLSRGHAATLTKWNISLTRWMELKIKWVRQGTIVPDLRHSTTKEAMARAEAAKKRTEEVLAEELGKENIPRFSTVREEIDQTPDGLEKEYLKADDKIEITVGRLEELLRQVEYLRGYKQAVLDIFGGRP